jgi:aspartate/methionine/tyrosine aminotransferase
MDFSKDVVESFQQGYIHCVTSPNNPDGRTAAATDTCDVWDGAYAHSVYGWQKLSHTPNYVVAIGSAAKLLGLSGLRVGWLATKDKDLAQAARTYVELTTSGVSLASQQLVAQAMTWHTSDWLAKREFELARRDMLANGDAFRYYVSPSCDDVRGVPATGKGMFAYFKVKPDVDFESVLKKARVALVSGEACGERELGWYRMNMGHNLKYTEAALIAIKEALP